MAKKDKAEHHNIAWKLHTKIGLNIYVVSLFAWHWQGHIAIKEVQTHTLHESRPQEGTL